jgi:competence protein ComEC
VELPVRAPLLRLALPFALGIALEDALECAPWLAVAVACVGLGLWRVRSRGRGARSGEALLGLGLGALALAVRLHAPVPEATERSVALTALEAPLANPSGCRVAVYVHGARPGRALLRGAGELCALLPGERALARLQLERPRPPTNPGASDSRRRLERRGIRRSARLVDDAFARIAPAPNGPAAWLECARRAIGATLDPPDRPPLRSGALLRALAIADTSRLDDALRAVFAESGTTHLLSVSGTHVVFVVWIVAAALGFALRRAQWLPAVRFARTGGLGLGVLAGVGYAVLCGLGPPALRAAAMAFAAGVALLGGRRAAAWNALALAGLAVLALDPAALFEASFQLSFLAVAGLLLWRPPAGLLRGSAHVSLAAGLATAPLAASIGAPLPAGWLLANALAVPYFSAGVVPLALAGGALGERMAWLVPLARAAAELGIRGLESLASPDLLAGPRDPLALSLALAAAGFGLRALALGRRRVSLALLCGAACAGIVAAPAGNRPVVTPSLLVLDVGHGDALLLRAGPHAWLVDAGTRFAGFDAGRAVVVPALRAEGVHRLDALVVSHADLDHAGGAASVLEALPVGELWLTRESLDARALWRLRRVAARRAVPVRVIAAGDERAAPELRLRALWPPASHAPTSTNAGSIVLRVETRSACALLGGDAPAEVELALVSSARPCAVLKLGHHGSATSSDPRFLDALAPELAIASAGRRPRAPLPHPRVRGRLRARSISLWQTRRDGALWIALEKPGPLVIPWLSRPFRED